MKFVASCLCVTIVQIFLLTNLGCNATEPQVSLTTNLDNLTNTTGAVVQFTCTALCLPYLRWYYNQTEPIAEYSIINNLLQDSYPLNLSILESSGLSSNDGVEVVIVNATRCHGSPLLADYISTLTINVTVLSQLSIHSVRCGTVNDYNETLVISSSDHVTRLTIWNIVLTVCGPLLWLIAVGVTITGPGTMCIRIEWWHGVYICQAIVEVILLVITACLWIGFGATVGNIRSYRGDVFISRRNDLCVCAFVFSLLSLVWIVMAVGFVHVMPQCKSKGKSTMPKFEAEVEENICGFDEDSESHKDSEPNPATVEL